jgi:membrane fusion protein, multidrug efflux system
MENKILNHTFIMKLRKIIPAAVLLVLITTVLIGCGKGGEEPKTEESAQDKQKLPIVKVMDVTTSSFSENLNVVGIVKPFAMAKISSEEGGLITVLNKEKGSYVRRGEIIARIKKDVEIATFEQTEAQLELARMNYEKQKALYEDNATTEVQYLTAKWQYEAAVRGQDVLKTRLKTGFIRSPINGFVNEKYMNRGEMTAPGSPIINVIDISSVKISAGIPERFIEQIKMGQQVTVTVDVLPGVEFTGKINYIAPSLSAVNRTLEIEVIINNRDKILKPEMSANVEVTQATNNNAVVLPQDYIIDFGENNKYVFVLEGDVAKKRMINIGGREGNNVMISSGLNPGDKLIYEGFQQLADNDKVQVLN